MSSNEIYLNKNDLDKYFFELGKLLFKRAKNKNLHVELIVVGGASIILNYGFRSTTVDIDCIDVYGVLMNEIVDAVGDKYGLPRGWINTDFTKTASYSQKLIQFSKLYKTYGNGMLEIRTISNEYLLAMKIVSGRKYKNDFSDMYGIVKYHFENNIPISLIDIDRAIIELYGDKRKVDADAYEFVKSVINNPHRLNENKIKSIEEGNSIKIKKNNSHNEDLDQFK